MKRAEEPITKNQTPNEENDVTLGGLFLRPEILLPLFGLSVLAAAPIAFKYLRRRNPLQPPLTKER